MGGCGVKFALESIRGLVAGLPSGKGCEMYGVLRIVQPE